MNDKCSKCELRINCEMACKGFSPLVAPCNVCVHEENSIHKDPCIRCHVFAMDGYCNFNQVKNK